MEPNYFEHPDFLNYSAYLTGSVRPDCESCPIVIDIVNSLIVKLIQNNINKPKSEKIHSLILSQIELIDELDKCPGPDLVPIDVNKEIEAINSAPYFTKKFKERAILRVMPIKEICRMPSANHKNI